MDKNLNKSPTISVVMSVYNGADYVREAIDSILGQTFFDFEFIIINDGSTDKTSEILLSYSDKRIVVISQKNQGLVRSLNIGVDKSRGKYIARQDADDSSNPKRLEKQVEYFNTHPDVVLVGSSINVMDENSHTLHQHHLLLGDSELRQELLVRSPFAHGSIMMKRSAFIKTSGYREIYWPAEDYDLWLRLSQYGKLANINECLYNYREHGESISAKNIALQNKAMEAVQKLAWNKRDQLVVLKKIHFSHYKKLTMGQQRVERITSNTRLLINKALKDKDFTFISKLFYQVSLNFLLYKKIAGILKRRIIQ